MAKAAAVVVVVVAVAVADIAETGGSPYFTQTDVAVEGRFDSAPT